jgi:ectoine hydroxylase-related dioxygenase (phytanoyl-CoA dioxygenase family)
MTINNLLDTYFNRGWVVIPDVFEHVVIDEVLSEYYNTKHIYDFYHTRKGIKELVANASHHTHVTAPKMWDLLDNDVVQHLLDNIFKGPAIVNTMGLSEVTSSPVYTQNIHRDVRTNTGAYPLWLNMLIMLDDSTVDNGASWLLEGSQMVSEQPGKEHFFNNAVRATGKKGDLLVFDCNLWHCAGENNTDLPRRIITPFFSRPFIKQQLDIPRVYGEGFGECVSDRLKQFMGYDSRVPTSLGEFYQKDDNRFYKSSQG